MYKELSTAALLKRVNDGNERRAPTELNTNSRHSLAKMQRLLMFWSTEKQPGMNMRQHKPSRDKSGLYSNSPNRHRQDKFRLALRENRLQRYESWSLSCTNHILTWIRLHKFSDFGSFLVVFYKLPSSLGVFHGIAYLHHCSSLQLYFQFGAKKNQL